MKKILEKVNKLSLPVTIIIASIILGGFYFLVQINKQESIEKQQRLELQAEKEQQNREYISKRKLDCLAIYEVENDKWSNVRDWRYEPIPYADGFLKDVCEIIYTNEETEEDFIKSF